MERRRLRQLFRLLRREPLFCLATAGVLALGIGASTAMLSVVDAILFRPLALPDSERVVTLCETHATVSGHCTASPPNVMDWASRSHTLAAVGIGRTTSFAWRGDDGARWLTGGIATPGFFRALGIEPLLGRLLEDRDLPPRAAEPVALVSEAFWRRELGGDPQALGRRLVLDETAHTVVGVLPGDRFVPWSTAELWTPVPFDPRDEEHRGWRGFMAVARLAAGATPHAAQTELAGLQRQLEAEHPAELRGWGTDVAPLRERLVGDSRPALLLFLAAVVVLLMVVCASTATLLIARAAGRESELALRKALGATAADAWRQQLRETGLLVLLGTLGGLLVAWAAVRGFVALAPAGIPRVEEIAVDLRMVLLGLAAAAVTASAVALVLVARQRRLEPGEVLRSPRGAGRRESRARRALVVAQLALAVMLVVGAGLLARSLGRLLDWQPGFDTARVLTFQLFLSDGRYQEPAQVLATYRAVERELAALPGVTAVGTASTAPLLGGGDGRVALTVAGAAAPPDEQPAAAWFDVGPGYFPALGVPLVAGRGFSERDAAGAPGALLVNQTLARRLAPGGSPLGARLELRELDFAGEVVGVVADVPPLEADRPVEPELYLSNRQRTRWATYFVVRTSGDPRSVAASIAPALSRIDRELLPSRLRTLDDAYAGELRRPRFHLALVGALALVAVLLGAAGVHGVVAFAVSRRSRAIAVRLALGARPAQVLGSILAEGLRLVAIGAALGTAAAIAAARLLSGLLHGVAPHDAVAVAGAVLALAGAGLAACLGPALRASRVQPALTLRAE